MGRSLATRARVSDLHHNAILYLFRLLQERSKERITGPFLFLDAGKLIRNRLRFVLRQFKFQPLWNVSHVAPIILLVRIVNTVKES